MAMIASAQNRILVQGHRGARAAMPENTIPAFEYAIKAGVDVLELDVAVTKDNVLVVSHDPLVNAAICEGPYSGRPIRTLTLNELRQMDCGSRRNPAFAKQQPVPGTRVPTLDEVLALKSKGSFAFNIETKIFREHPEYTPPPEEFARMMLDAIRRHKLEKRVILQSFDFRTLHAMKRLAPEIQLAALFQKDERPFTEFAKEAGSKIVSPNFSLVTKEKVDAAHRAGLTVIPWTPNTPEDWKRMIDAGVDQIITDDPAGLISFLKQVRP